ncbi:MAG: aminopeptidase P N-terminal domain-containing protein [Acidobacteria bacterium]|nr:aminopeptidase P N-terminal domain-containing protein [Acidobacteriota bacterium]MCA1648996.1 aminopeptidase P N-terminal domain-containing protein [Acidobacteriota bacterium]
MLRRISAAVIAMLPVVLALSAYEQAGRPRFSTVFRKEEFATRRGRILDAIGPTAIALVQGAPTVHSSAQFRQSNEFFYLTGVTVPQAYLLLDGAQRRSVLYLPKRDERRAATEGALLSADDPGAVTTLTGIDEVRSLEQLTDDVRTRESKATAIYTPFQPAEGDSESRDGAKRRNADAAADPWDGRPSREARFADLIRSRVAGVEVRDLSPTLDSMRRLKSEAEIAVIDRATRIGGEAILEAMRSTEPGVLESETCRWQATITIGEFIDSKPTRVWAVARRLATSPKRDLRAAASAVLLEHLLECQSTRMIPVIRAEPTRGDRRFASAIAMCWNFGTARTRSRIQKIIDAAGDVVTRRRKPDERTRMRARR